ncbi:MAG TPA: enediyne biosynthesis protein UnbU [Jatrophihabitans sp.]|uniref:enediyne biosynthesis protein UnbU n=1 Tax=Jatrophihabitans sp. TaxID=1932789 RepID=UPI002F0783EB
MTDILHQTATAQPVRTPPEAVPVAAPPVAEKPAPTSTATVPAQPKPVDKRVKALTRFAVSISVLTVLGQAFLGFEQSPITPVVCLLASYASALAFEAVDSWAYRRRPEYAGSGRKLFEFLLPPHITALACAMLLYGNADLWPYVFAVIVGNGSKYLFRVRVNGRLKHFLNPSNTGIAVTLLLFHWVGIAPPYQFTNNYHLIVPWALPLGILMLGTMLNSKLTGKMPLILAWVAGFVGQAVVRWALDQTALISALMPLTGVAFILFTNYMITDPGSTPFTRRGQIIFGLSTAAVYGVLLWNGVVFGLFFALVITCVLRGLVLVTAPSARRLRARLRPPAPPRPAVRAVEVKP